MSQSLWRRIGQLVVEAEQAIDSISMLTPGNIYDYSPWLERAWDRARGAPNYDGIGPFSVANFVGLESVPKDALKNHPFRFMIGNMSSYQRYYETSGTTGRPTVAPRVAEDSVYNAVSVAAQWKRFVSGDDRVLSLLPSDLVPVGDLIADVMDFLGIVRARCYPFAMGVVDWDRVVHTITTMRPTVVFAAPGVIAALGEALARRGLDRADLGVSRIMLLGEVSAPAYRRALERRWQAQVLDASYGSTETGTLATACDFDSLHLSWNSNYFELLDPCTGSITELPNDPDDLDVDGRLIVTGLFAFGRPALRVDTGDEIRFRECACGNPGLAVEVLGRTSDTFDELGCKLTPRDIEDAIFSSCQADGYLIDVERDTVRLQLLRDIGTNEVDEASQIDDLQSRFEALHGLRWPDVQFVDRLPAATRGGGALKNWTKTHVRRSR